MQIYHQHRLSAPHAQQRPGSLRSCACRSPATRSARRGGPPSVGTAGQSRHLGALQGRADRQSAQGAVQPCKAGTAGVRQPAQERGCSSRDGHRRAAAELASGALRHNGGARTACAAAGRPPRGMPGPASTLSRAHLLPTQASGGAVLTHEVGRLLVAAEKGSHTGTPVGIAVPAYKGCLPVNLHEPSHLQRRRGRHKTALISSIHSTLETREPPAGVRAECKESLAQDAVSWMPAQRGKYRQSCVSDT